MRPGAPSRGTLAIGLEVLGIALAIGTVALFRDCVVDDAYIGLRYADNLLRGDGLVYNPGDRVEGITNLGFVLAVAALGRLGIDLLVAARFLGLCGGGIAVWLAPAAVLPGEDRRLARAVARLLCLSNFAFVYLSWTGLETGAFAGLVAATVYAQTRSSMRWGPAPGIVAGLAFVVRPEGLLVTGVGMAIAARRDGVLSVVRSAGTVATAGMVAVVEAFRFGYYGAWVPNTARVKGLFTAGTPSDLPWYGTFGDDFVEMFAQSGGAVVLVLVVLALARPPTREGDRERTWLAAGVVAALCGFEIYAGGDWMLGYRYLLPMLPLYLSLAAGGGFVAVESALAPAPGKLWPALALGAVIVVAGHSWSYGLRFRHDAGLYPNFVMTSRDMTSAARWLAEHYSEDTQITCWRIGALGYYSHLRVIDENGLTDRRIAETLADAPARQAYVAGKSPELAIVRGRPGEPAPPAAELYGGHYQFVREFPQGTTQTWRLYGR